jgi:protein-disulfide isomerase
MRSIWIWVGLAILVMLGGALGWREYQSRETPAPQVLAEAENLPMEVTAKDRVLGRPDAPITIIEYASLTCPHCASFHRNTLPKLKSEYIDKGLARLVYRDFPLDKFALRAAAIARCAPPDQYFGLIELFFENQKQWAGEADPAAALDRLAAVAGMDQATIEACLADQAKTDAIVSRAQDAQAKYQIESTPSFIINGRKVTGARSFESFQEFLKDMLPKS